MGFGGGKDGDVEMGGAEMVYACILGLGPRMGFGNEMKGGQRWCSGVWMWFVLMLGQTWSNLVD